MMRKETKYALELIVDKANKLREFGFEQHVQETGLNFHIERNHDDTLTLEFDLPDEKERDAFLLTFRLFYQKNEPISFQNLTNLACDPGLSQRWRNEATRLRQEYYNYLSGYSDYTVELFEGHPTRLQMLVTGLYGGLAHANNPNRVQKFQEWTRDDVRAFLFQQEFARILLNILGLIYQLAEISSEELESN